ncbi:diguanylate cyclase [Oceanispirochaeta sp.]|uniref:diguanylate cyclase n=1 Tax=Oceanispirochaeta sp. TaxID=2035350 RepID=UPI002604EA0A|nr:diguanylate cyclase [Oceanispirochaeta sp.]MDA3958086.1 diguanylate cyclase [Oceanispirochaeta sp.]
MNILLVDDRKENILTLESLLDNPDFSIKKAESGQEALEMLLDNEIALVLLDVQMPGMDGYETAELMRSSSRTRHIPIIFVTANSLENDHIFKGYDAGAVDYLTKPIEPMVLKCKVGIFLEIHRQKIELEHKTYELNAKIVELEELQQQLEEKNKQLKAISNLDGLTGISNRRYFNEILDKEWFRNLRDRKKMSILMMDIDHFKSFNDTYGHTAGDDALKNVAETISQTLKRRSDTLSRYGGEEFVAILPDTDKKGAIDLAERIILAITGLGIRNESSPVKNALTLSIGVSTMIPEKGQLPMTIVSKADDALYMAKGNGRNRVEYL